MTNWKEYRLIDIADFIDYRGKTPNKTSFGVPLITAKIVKNGTIQMPTEFISKEDYPKWMTRGFPKVGDVVLTTEAPLGEVAQIKDASFALAQRIITIRGKEGIIDNGYLKYFLQSSKGQHRLKERETGTTVTGIKSAELKQVLISAPDFKTQTAIAEILSSLDDKIELNNKINQELENLAQTLFKQWFIDFEFPNENGEPYKSSGGEMVESELGEIPKGWEVSEIGLVAKLGAGGDKPKIVSEVPTEEINVPIYSNGITNDGLYGYTDKAKIFEESVTISARGTIGFVCLRTTPYVPIVRLISASADKQYISTKYLYMWLKNQNIFGNGTTQQQLTVPDFKSSKILIPSYSLVNEYTHQMNNIIENINFNKLGNQSLTNLRDTLLPKLISGELEVAEVLAEKI